MKKRVIAVMLAATVAFSLTGCGSKKPAETAAPATAAPAAAAASSAAETEPETKDEAPKGVVHEAGGIKATFPESWNVKDGENSIVASFRSDELFGGVTFLTAVGADPEKLADSWEGEKLKKTYNGRDFFGVIEEIKFNPRGEGEVTSYHLNLFSAFNDKRSLQVGLNMKDFKPEEYKKYLDDERYAASWIRSHCSFKPRGSIRLVRDLCARGVSRKIADEAVKAYFENVDEYELCDSALKKLLTKNKNVKKLLKSLADSGFSYKIIQRVLKNNRVGFECDSD